jgi:hypothetical protein
LLFARFPNNYAYLINIFPHGVWAEQELVGIIHRNWPESISDYRVTRIGVRLAYTQNYEVIAKLREAKINTYGSRAWHRISTH